MSKFRLELDVSFNTEADLIALVNLIESWKSKVYLGTGVEPIEVITTARYHECFHDEIPPRLCGDYKYVDFINPKITNHVTKDGKVMAISSDGLNTTEVIIPIEGGEVI